MISLILVAGGKGERMGGGIPKQFRLLRGKPLALYSYELFSEMEEICERIVVCEPCYQHLFSSRGKPLHFALPGKRRQESVYQGLMVTSEQAEFVCVHDAARPFLDKETVRSCIQKAQETGAAALAVPVQDTIKRVEGTRVIQTLSRQELWALQTPQIINRRLFFAAHQYAIAKGIEATDDLSLLEALGHPTFIVRGTPNNVKITTPFDWEIACASK